MTVNLGMLGWICGGATHMVHGSVVVPPIWSTFPACCAGSQPIAYQLSALLVSLGLPAGAHQAQTSGGITFI